MIKCVITTTHPLRHWSGFCSHSARSGTEPGNVTRSQPGINPGINPGTCLRSHRRHSGNFLAIFRDQRAVWMGLYSGHGGHSQPPAPLSLKWRRSLRDPVWASDSWSCPEEASASELALEGFLFLWAVLSCPVCLALEGFPVLFCTVLSV